MATEMAEKLRIRELIENWVVWRDAGLWEQFRTVWADGAAWLRDGTLTR